MATAKLAAWSQQTNVQWIDASDSQAKQDIHTLANINIWTELHQWCREQYRNTKESVAVAEQSIDQKKTAFENEVRRLQQSESNAEKWHAETSERIKEIFDRRYSLEKLQILSTTEVTCGVCLLSTRQPNASVRK